MARRANWAGVTVGHFSRDLYPHFDELFADMGYLGLSWLRWQQSLKLVDRGADLLDWRATDDAVGRANAAGLRITVVLRNPPEEGLLLEPCDPISGHRMPDPAYFARMGALYAARYNGRSIENPLVPGTYLRAETLEVGNEDFDAAFTFPITGPQPCRDFGWYVPVLRETSRAIRAVPGHPGVGLCALWWRQLPHLYDFTRGVWQAGGGRLARYGNFHFYSREDDPTASGPAPGYTNGVRNTAPSITEAIDALTRGMRDGGGPLLPLWLTEVGWPTNTNRGETPVCTEEEQARRLVAVLDACRLSGRVRRVAVFTLNYDEVPAPASLVQAGRRLPAYERLAAYTRMYPRWS